MEDARLSDRLVEQRLRNRVMESLELLSLGDDGVRAVGVVDYVEGFFDWIGDDRPWDWRTCSCFTPAEIATVEKVLRLVVAACNATPGVNDVEGFIVSGWPGRICPAAAAAFDLMTRRGRFDEEHEELEPSHTG